MTAEQIKKARTWAGHTQTQAAAIAGLSQGAWGDCESGRRTINPANWDKYATAITPTLLLIRGLPGSGKSTIARAMLDAGQIDAHFEADMWLHDDSGNYMYSPDRVIDADKNCIAATRDAMRRGQRVAVSNTFIKLWQLDPYHQIVTDLHDESGLIIQQQTIVATGCYSNIHNVPADALKMMRDSWED